MHSRGRGRSTAIAALVALVLASGGGSGAVAQAAPVARGCDLVDGASGALLARFPGPIALVAAPEGGPFSLTLWELPLTWAPGTPLPTRGPIFPDCGTRVVDGAPAAGAAPVPDDDTWPGMLL